MEKQVINDEIVHFYAENGDEQTINLIFQEKENSYKGLELAINFDNNHDVNGYMSTGLFYDAENNFQQKIENYFDSNNFEIKSIEYDSNDEIKRIIKYENYSNGESKWIRSYDKDGNLLSEDFYEKDF